MDVLTFLTKLFLFTGRLGFGVFVGTMIIAILRWWNVEPLASIDLDFFRWLVVSGVIGFGIAVPEGIGMLKGPVARLRALAALRAAEATRRSQAARNFDHLRPPLLMVLAYCLVNDQRRIVAQSKDFSVELLRDLHALSIIESADDGTLAWSGHVRTRSRLMSGRCSKKTRRGCRWQRLVS